jgi:hypothetical protein
MKSKREITGVIATFHDRKHAEHYVEELKRAGFKDDEIGILGPPSKGDNVEEDALAGAITGGMLGAVAGAAATVFIPGIGPFVASGLLVSVLGGTVAGATAGGALGALIGLGIPEEKAREHERELMAGRTLVVVQAEGRGWQAMELLENCAGRLREHAPLGT